MDKELEALNELKNITIVKELEDENGLKRVVFASEVYKKQFDIVETALKNYKELTNRPVILYGRTQGHTQALIDMISRNYKEIKITNLDDENKLKVFEIIKNKRVDTHFLLSCRSLKEYNDFSEFTFCKKLTQDEYDLLREELI